jgi:type IV pilus assembly protein PilA
MPSARPDQGFTLVELMVVVLIIGILVAVAIPVFYGATATVMERSCQGNLRTLDGAVEQWKSAAPLNDPVTWTTLAAAEPFLKNYVKDWSNSTKCPVGTGGVDGLGSYATSITPSPVVGAPGLCTFRCPNGHAYASN